MGLGNAIRARISKESIAKIRNTLRAPNVLNMVGLTRNQVNRYSYSELSTYLAEFLYPFRGYQLPPLASVVSRNLNKAVKVKRNLANVKPNINKLINAEITHSINGGQTVREIENRQQLIRFINGRIKHYAKRMGKSPENLRRNYKNVYNISILKQIRNNSLVKPNNH